MLMEAQTQKLLKEHQNALNEEEKKDPMEVDEPEPKEVEKPEPGDVEMKEVESNTEQPPEESPKKSEFEVTPIDIDPKTYCKLGHFHLLLEDYAKGKT